MQETIIITGYNGELAKETHKLLKNNYNIISLTTNKKYVDNNSIFYWNPEKNTISKNALKNCNHIIHLAGYSILKRWTKKNKELMYSSRIEGANLLFKTCKELNISPHTFITASAIGIYGLNNSGVKKEDDLIGNDWVAKMAYDWESSAKQFRLIGTRVIKMRISLLFSRSSGLLKYTILSMKYGIGIIIGDGKAKISWIHIHDAANFIKEAIKNKNYQGPYNLANDQIISQEELLRNIKNKLFPHALIIKIPIKLITLLIGERSSIINISTTLNIDKLKKTGFQFKCSNLSSILKC